MRKICLLLPAITLVMASCKEKAPTTSTTVTSITDLAQDRLKGNVTKVITETYTVDSLGKQGNMDSKTITAYDENGNMTTFTQKSGKDSLISETTNTVNANGFTTKQSTIDGKGKKKSSLVLEVDSAGKYSIVLKYDTTGKIDTYYKNILQNKYMQVTSADAYYAKDSTLKSKFLNTYDSIYWVGGTVDSAGKVIYSGKLVLNSKKDDSTLTETNVEKGVSKTTAVSYTYDAWDPQGNWTKQTTLNEKGKPSKITMRTITYK